METNNNNSEMQTYCNQIGPTAVFNKLMELQDLWTGHIKSICDDYAKTDKYVNKFANTLRNSGEYPFGIDIRAEFARYDETFINMTCAIDDFKDDMIAISVDSHGYTVTRPVKMEYLLHQDKPALVKKLWTDYLQNFLKQTETEIVDVKADYDYKMLTTTRLKVELDNLKNQ